MCLCFQVVKRRLLQFTGQHLGAIDVVSDFELSIITAVQTELPNATIRACYFHLTQSLWRRVQDLGLSVPYRTRRQVRELIRKVMAIAFLPLALVRANLQLLITSADWRNASQRYPALNDFMRYFVATYMDENGNYPPAMWNVFRRNVATRTNNYLEG